MSAIDILTECWELGLSAPTNVQIAERLGITRIQAINIIKRLEQLGLVRVDRYPRSRVIICLKTGRETAGLVGPIEQAARDLANGLEVPPHMFEQICEDLGKWQCR